LSFASVFIDVRVANPVTGDVTSFSLPGTGEVFPYFQSVTISMARSVSQTIEVILSPPYEDAIKLISKDSKWLRVGNTLAVRWGYADIEGMMTDWHYGFMLRPTVSFGEEISITVPAKAMAWHMDRVARCRDWSSSESPVTLRSIAEKIASRYGLVIEFCLSDRIQLAFETVEDSFVQGGRTDMQFLMYESERRGAKLIIQNGKLMIVDSTGPNKGYPDVNATFYMYAKIDTQNNVLPMDSFDAESTGALFLRQLQGIATMGYGPDSNPEEEPEMKRSDGDSTENGSDMNSFTSGGSLAIPPKEDGKAPPPAIGGVKVKSLIKRIDEDDECGRIIALPATGGESEDFIKNQVAAINDENADEHGIPVNFSAIAIPNLLPGMMVGLKGIGDYFSGTYMLNEMEISVSTSGATMNCSCFGRGFPGSDATLEGMFGSAKVSNPPAEQEGSVQDENIEANPG